MKGLRKYLTPFAPDQSGAVSVLYGLNALIVVVDAGGCAGNICTFDEPRWPGGKSVVVSAALRDMDAILGRDDILTDKLVKAAKKTDASLIALVSTPVPAIIGTDLEAVARITEKKTGIRCVSIPTDGMKLCDFGMQETYLALFRRFASGEKQTGVCGVIGMTPMDYTKEDAENVCTALRAEGYEEILLYGAAGGIGAFQDAGKAEINYVVSPAGAAAAKWLEKKFKTPWICRYPADAARLTDRKLTEDDLRRIPAGAGSRGRGEAKRILVVHQQVMANALREKIRDIDGEASVTCATWFMKKEELSGKQDRALRDEDDFIELVRSGNFDAIIADPCMKEMIPFFRGVFLPATHFAVSGSQRVLHVRKKIRVYGIVQGVGFRPFVARTAMRMGISGTVCNRGSYVEILAEGSQEAVSRFIDEVRYDPPRRAVVLKVDVKDLPEGLKAAEEDLNASGFEIIESEKEKGEIFISPDIATCDECRRELFDPGNRRYLHPFINCTQCGPRLTILDELPYDRMRTSMKEFEMCPDCAKEYTDPASRRYDAQPVCCHDCGPEVFLITPDEAGNLTPGAQQDRMRGAEAIRQARRMLAEGKILAVKGIGGFHLCCDASNDEAVAELRKRKTRPHKPFAVMMKDMHTVRRECAVDQGARRILEGHQKPVLLLVKKPGSQMSDQVAPGNPKCGVMLPYTPLHMLLFDYPDGLSMPDMLVMTSGNVSGAPICRTDEEAVHEIGIYCDAILTHDRKIRIRCDDSVMDYTGGEGVMIRRSRGYAPLPVITDIAWSSDKEPAETDRRGMGRETDSVPSQPDETKNGRTVLAVGSELKNTFCIGIDDLYYPSPHIGDLADVRSVRSLKETIHRMEELLEKKADVIVCDRHPAYHSSEVAAELARERGARLIEIQHHFAHVVSCMAENDEKGPVIGVTYDGTGLGDDGSIWGGEILVSEPGRYARAASIAPFIHVGGDLASRQGWRIAVSMLDSLLGEEAADKAAALGLCDEKSAGVICRMKKNSLASVRSTSCGRLFDAAAAILGICTESTYEGEAACALQFAAERGEKKISAGKRDTSEAKDLILSEEVSPGRRDDGENRLILRTDLLIRELAERKLAGEDPEVLAFAFHRSLARMTAEAVRRISSGEGVSHGPDVRSENTAPAKAEGACGRGVKTAALTGGVFQNSLLLALTKGALEKDGMKVITHRLIPPNDGGLCLGQAVAARAMLAAEEQGGWRCMRRVPDEEE